MKRTVFAVAQAARRSPVAILVLATSLLAVSLAVGPASAQYVEHRVNDDLEGQEARRDPVAARLAGGEYVVLWSDNGRGHTDVLHRVFDTGGVPVTEVVRVNTEQGFFQQEEIAISSASGGIIFAAWEDSRDGATRIYGRHLDATTGTPIGSDFRVDVDFAFAEASDPDVAVDAAGTAIIAWTTRVAGAERVVLQRIDRDGNRVGTNLLPVENNGQIQERPAIAALPDGNWMLAWAEFDNDVNQMDWNIYYAVLDEEGLLLGDVLRANTDQFSAGRQHEPTILVRDDDVLLAWNDNRQGTADVWGRWTDFDGAPEGQDARLREVQDDRPDSRPSLVAGPDGGYALFFLGAARASAKFFAPDRTELTATLLMDDPPEGVFMRDGVGLPSPEGWRFWWSDNRTLVYDIYTRTFDPAGLEAGPIETIHELPRSASQLYPDVALFPDGSAVVAWADFQYASLSIFVRMLDANGEPTGSSQPVNDIPPGAILDTIDDLNAIDDFSPSVAASEAGFVVTWAINEEGGRLNVYGQLFDRAGVRIGGNFLIADGLQDIPQWDARPVMYADGSFAIAYRMSIADSGGDIYLQRYLTGGQPNGARIPVIDSGALAAPQAAPQVDLSPFDELLVAWVDSRFGGPDVLAQRFTPSFEPIGDNVPQHGTGEPSDNQTNPSASISGDRMVVVWDDRPLLSDGGRVNGRLEIFPSLRGADGNGTQAREVISFQANLGQRRPGVKHPDVSVAPDGRFLVTWWDNSDGQTRLQAQRFDVDGEADGDAYPIHGTGMDGSRLRARVEATNEFIQFVYSDSRRGHGWDVRARRVDWSFNGAPNPVAIAGWNAASTEDGLELSWRTALERNLAGFHVWREPADTGIAAPSAEAVRVTDSWIEPSEDGSYAFVDRRAPVGTPFAYLLEAIDLDGTREFHGPFAATRESSPDRPQALNVQAWPNPFADALHLRVPQVGSFRLEIVDVSGRQVREVGVLSDGETPVIWDGRDRAGNPVPAGIYFVRPVANENENASRNAEGVKLLRLR